VTLPHTNTYTLLLSSASSSTTSSTTNISYRRCGDNIITDVREDATVV
jgi:hypothetical protein